MKFLLTLISLIPAIIEAVKAFEASTEGAPNLGAQKAEALLGMVQAGYEQVVEIHKDFSFDKLKNAIVPMISIFVSFANKVGLFKTKTVA